MSISHDVSSTKDTGAGATAGMRMGLHVMRGTLSFQFSSLDINH